MIKSATRVVLVIFCLGFNYDTDEAVCHREIWKFDKRCAQCFGMANTPYSMINSMCADIETRTVLAKAFTWMNQAKDCKELGKRREFVRKNNFATFQ
jgi:hypothetical protein